MVAERTKLFQRQINDIVSLALQQDLNWRRNKVSKNYEGIIENWRSTQENEAKVKNYREYFVLRLRYYQSKANYFGRKR